MRHTRRISSAARAYRLRYPDGPHNAEALLVHPRTGDLYIVTAVGGKDRDTRVYVARARELKKQSVTLTALGMPAPLFARLVGGITGGEMSPDGHGVVLCDCFRIYEAGLPRGSADFDAIWEQQFRPATVGLGLEVEGVCFRADGKAIIATSRGSPAAVFEIVPQ